VGGADCANAGESAAGAAVISKIVTSGKVRMVIPSKAFLELQTSSRLTHVQYSAVKMLFNVQ